MRQKLETEIINTLIPHRNVIPLDEIRAQITIILSNYDVESRCTEVAIPSEEKNKRFIAMFLASKAAGGRTEKTLHTFKSLGTHPVAYVQIPSKPIDTREISCHGGVTYSEGDLNIDGFEVKGFWIGWDYAHWGDCFGCLRGKKWTTEEIVEECKNVIDQLIEMGY